MKRPRARLSAIATIAVIVAACSSMQPVTDRALIGGQKATAMALVLSSPFSFRPGLVKHMLPAGRYVPAFEDDEGVYFQAPTKIAVEDIIAPSLYDGGIYVRRDQGGAPQEYLIMGPGSMLLGGLASKPRFFTLPQDFRYSLERSH